MTPQIKTVHNISIQYPNIWTINPKWSVMTTGYSMFRKTDCLVVGELYRVIMPYAKVPIWKACYAVDFINGNFIGFLERNQIVTYLGESVFWQFDKNSPVERMPDEKWFYKLFMGDQVGYVAGHNMRLRFLKTEHIFQNHGT